MEIYEKKREREIIMWFLIQRIQRESDRDTDRERQKETGRGRQTQRETNRPTERDKQTDRQKEKDRQTQTEIYREGDIFEFKIIA